MRTAISLSAIMDYVRAFDGIPQSRISLEVLTDNFFLYGRVYRSSVCYDPLNVWLEEYLKICVLPGNNGF